MKKLLPLILILFAALLSACATTNKGVYEETSRWTVEENIPEKYDSLFQRSLACMQDSYNPNYFNNWRFATGNILKAENRAYISVQGNNPLAGKNFFYTVNFNGAENDHTNFVAYTDTKGYLKRINALISYLKGEGESCI